jgi:hypothetical protein
VVAGDVWIAGSIAFYGAERPSVFIDAEPAKSPWIDAGALRREGAVLIWQPTAGEPPRLRDFPTAQRQPEIELPYVPPLGHPPVRLDWAIVPPAS